MNGRTADSRLCHQSSRNKPDDAQTIAPLASPEYAEAVNNYPGYAALDAGKTIGLCEAFPQVDFGKHGKSQQTKKGGKGVTCKPDE